jgi:hypothetical protein
MLMIDVSASQFHFIQLPVGEVKKRGSVVGEEKERFELKIEIIKIKSEIPLVGKLSNQASTIKSVLQDEIEEKFTSLFDNFSRPIFE